MGLHSHDATLLVTRLIFIVCFLPQVPGIYSHTQKNSLNNYNSNFPSHLKEQIEFSRFRRFTARVLQKSDDHQILNGHSPQDRLKREISHTRNYEGTHWSRIEVEIPLEGSSHQVLDLQLNKNLIPKNYFVRSQKNKRSIVRNPTLEEVNHCHYHGKVRGQPNSWAAISTCGGISGIVFYGNRMHYLEPANFVGQTSNLKELVSSSSKDPNLNKWDTIHVVENDLTRNFSCGHNHEVKWKQNAKFGMNFRTKRDAADGLPEPFNSNEKSRYVEMVIVVDNKKFMELGGDMSQTEKKTKDIANIVNALYNPLNVFITLVGIVVWNESDEITIKPNGDDTLASFLHYRRERLSKLHPNDNAQLLTAMEFENGVVGKAMQGPICSYQYSGGVNSYYKNTPIGVVATTVAHELGHNFGLSHDSESCECGGYGSRCIMAASSSATNRTSHWSSCSMKDMAYAFDHGMDYCLRNKPKSLYNGPTCGNGFTEPGEQCDCGLPEHCENPCCDANTCLLHLNATCGAGNCCDLTTCHVKSGGTVCRSPKSTCDLPEYCTGDSEFCPDDVHKSDGLQCVTSVGQAHCYDGECRTHTDQCRLLWGPSGNNSNELCYQKNTNGSRLAHCGYNLVTKKYTPCKPEDVKCGVLHCQMNNEKLEFGYESVSILASFFVNAGRKIHPCRSVTVDFGLQDVDPGLVPDGAKCGDDTMCMAQKCVPVKSILGSRLSTCAGDCSGHGVCNSKGHCHCDNGYGGTLCEGSGYGGSIDSGPSADPYGTSKFGKALYVTFLGFVPLIAIITFYLYYANDNIKKLCKRGQAVTRSHNQNRNNKPQGNGSASGGFRSVDISHPTPTSTNGPNQTAPDDFFGHYKGFTLAPIKQDGNTISAENGTSTTTVNNNISVSSRQKVGSVNHSPNSHPNGHIPSTTNVNVYYSPVCQVTNETLVKNSEKPSLKQSFLQKGIARVSWAQPIASPLPVSPGTGSDEDSAHSDTPMYQNIGHEHSDTTLEQPPSKPPPIPPPPANVDQRSRQVSSTDTTNEMKLLDGNDRNKSFNGKIDFRMSGSSALSRLVAAFPFARNSMRSNSNEDGNKTGTVTRPRSFPKVNRDTVEISKPILQGDTEREKIEGCIPVATPESKDVAVTQAEGTDEIDGCEKDPAPPRYANIASSPKTSAKPVLRNLTRVKQTTPPPDHKPAPKVVRAHSMIQPNRNSIGASTNNSNYNSLRRLRPTAPPPMPPEAPQLPSSESPKISSSTTAERVATPPAVPAPNLTTNTPSSSVTTLSSILKFSLGRRNSNASREKTPESAPLAPIAQSEDPSSPTTVNTAKENIYDVIAETPPSGSSEESSPKLQRKADTEKMETMSTGSSESNGGLLSEIIFEIQSRNKESIYNSVDRRKKKRESKAAAAAAAAVGEEKATSTSSVASTTKSVPKNQPKSVNGVISKNPKPSDNPEPKTAQKKPKVAFGPTVFSPSITKPSVTVPVIPKQPPSVYNSPQPPSSSETVTTTQTSGTTSSAKPTCAVNGVPKVASSLSYVAKINYFSNLGSGNKEKLATPMKPISSLPAPSKENSMKEVIYAASSGNNSGTPDGVILSTIRPTWSRPYYNNKQSYANNSNDDSENSGKKASIYGSLGRKVAAPVINPPVGGSTEKPKSTEKKEDSEKTLPANTTSVSQVGGYKPFNPYLNRPLTFSTFRPNSSSAKPVTAAANSKADLTMANPKPVTVSTYSVTKPVEGSGLGVTSPVALRSPVRMVK